MISDEIFMLRCLQLAKNGLGTTYPNPLVGSVIVHQNEIIGEGWHQKAGQPHAEVNAINSVKNKDLLKESTLYVNLEPCSHFGKTPPCADLIIKHNIKKVVVGCIDSFSEVSGRGIQKLQNAGIEVVTGILEEKCKEINKRFFTFHNKKRPFIILKWAETPNGFFAPFEKQNQVPFWISNEFSIQKTHKLRSEEQAILVGKNTIFSDNPSLTTRFWQGNSPIRLIIDKNLEIPTHFNVYNNEVLSIFFNKNKKEEKNNTIFEILDFEKPIFNQILEYLYQKNIQSLIVEGGAYLLNDIIEKNLWDEAMVFVGENHLQEGIKAPQLKTSASKEIKTKNDIFKLFINI